MEKENLIKSIDITITFEKKEKKESEKNPKEDKDSKYRLPTYKHTREYTLRPDGTRIYEYCPGLHKTKTSE